MQMNIKLNIIDDSMNENMAGYIFLLYWENYLDDLKAIESNKLFLKTGKCFGISKIT